MSVSCVGTCSACGVQRFWLSDTLSLQMDDGSLKCLRHPAEEFDCEDEGLTLAQASRRGRLYRETFYVCRNCGRQGEIIEPESHRSAGRRSVRGAARDGLVVAALGVPVCLWLRWWEAALLLGSTAVAWPWTTWLENRRQRNAPGARDLPRPDAPGLTVIGPPASGSQPGLVIGRKTSDSKYGPTATGPCCDRPHWNWAGSQRDDDQIPCCACGRGVMTVSEMGIH